MSTMIIFVDKMGVEVLMSDELQQTMDNGRGFVVTSISPAITGEDPNSANSGAKALGHELRAHNIPRSGGNEANASEEHKDYTGLGGGITIGCMPGSDACEYEIEVDSVAPIKKQ